jgi:hypothetical protein
MEMVDSDRRREMVIIVSCAASFRSLYTQKRTQQENLEGNLMQQHSESLEKSKKRSPKSTFVRDTILGAEYSLWESAASQDSREALWTTHGGGRPMPQALPLRREQGC